MAQDIILEQGGGQVISAKSVGQIGNPIYKGFIDANTLIETGNYICDLNGSLHGDEIYEKHWPYYQGYRVPVSILNDGTLLYQVLRSGDGFWVRWLDIANGNWSAWFPVGKIKLNSSAHQTLYISKDGNDTNTGFSPAYPVASFYRAVQIARNILIGWANGEITFRVGAGVWDSQEFTFLPFKFSIIPYDGNIPTEYSENLPQFTLMSFYNCQVRVVGIVADLVRSIGNSYLSIGIGYKKLNGVACGSSSSIIFESGTSSTNIWEIGDSSTHSMAIMIDGNSFVNLGAINIKLVEDMVNIDKFFMIQNTGELYFSNYDNTNFDYNGYIFGSYKAVINQGARINTNTNISDLKTALEKVFGATIYQARPVIFNNTSTNNIRKSGDILGGNDYITFTAVNPLWFRFSKDSKVEGHTAEGIAFRYQDINKNQLGYIEYALNSDNSMRWGVTLFSPKVSGKTAIFYVQLEANGTGYAQVNTPPLTHTGTSITTASWVNSKLGTGASLTALANIDTNDKSYIETPEIKSQKEIAVLNSEAQQTIYQDFPFDINGETYYFGYSLFDQQNLADLAISSLINPTLNLEVPCKTSEGNSVFLTVTPSQLQAIYLFGVSNKMNILKEANKEKQNILSKYNSQKEDL